MKKVFYVILTVFLVMAGVELYFQIKKYNFDDQKAIEFHQQDEGYQYHYQQLNEDEQKQYRRIYYAMRMQDNSVFVENEDFSRAEDIYYDVLHDHPELFYVKSSFEYIKNRNMIEFFPQYLYTQEEVEKLQQQIDESIQPIIQEAQKQKTDIEKIKVVYDYIIQEVEYQENENDQNILSALIDKKSVCAGYAKSYLYILEKLGIESCYMTGKTLENGQKKDDISHAWLMIHVNGDYYYSDPTWGDVDESDITHICTTYFLMNSQDLLKEYVPDTNYEETQNKQWDYFQDIDCYMETYDESILSQAVSRNLHQGLRMAEVKCANQQIYNELKYNMTNRNLGYRILKEQQCYRLGSSYYCDDNLRVVELYY